MLKIIGKRMLSMLLVLMLVFSLFVLPASAESHTYANGEVKIDCSTGEKVTVNTEDDRYTVSVEGYDGWDDCNDTATYNPTSSTVTVQNVSGKERIITFSYVGTVEGGGTASLSIDGESYDVSSGHYESVILSANQSVSISLTSPAGAGKKVIFSVTEVATIKAQPHAVNVIGADGGIIYAVLNDGDDACLLSDSSESYTFENVTAYDDVLNISMYPDEDYTLVGLFDEEGNLLCSGTDYDENEGYPLNLWSGGTVTASFILDKSVPADSADANWQVGKSTPSYFRTLQDAAEFSLTVDEKIVIPTKDITLDAGTYNIPAGVTLLVPFDDANTVYTTSSAGTYNSSNNATYVAPRCYRKLTLADGAELSVSGSISVGSKHYGSTTGCYPSGPYGQIELSDNAAIILNSEANLYTWGFITGNGQVEANPGAKVLEVFQITDLRGGNATTGMSASSKVFPFSQYYVQNIECDLIVHYGAVENVYMDGSVTATAEFIGSGGLFRMTQEGAYLKKYYDVSEDKVHFEIYGDATLGAITLMGQNTAGYVLPINNMEISQRSGTLTNIYDIELMPDSKVTIDQGASVVNSGEIYIFDVDDWGKYTINGYLSPLKYSPSLPANSSGARPSTRTYAKMSDAVVDVNGTITSEGMIATTAHGAAVISSQGTGVVNLTNKDAGTLNAYFQNNNKAIGYEQVVTTPVQLLNADGTYRLTEIRNDDNATFTYMDGAWTSGDNCLYNYVWKDKDGNELQRMENVRENATVEYEGDITELNYSVGEDQNKVDYDCVGWNIAYDAATATATLTPRYKEYKYYLVTWRNINGSNYTAYVRYLDIPSYYRPKEVLQYIDTTTAPRTYKTASSGAASVDTGMIVGNTTFYAYLGTAANKTVTYYNQYNHANGYVATASLNGTAPFKSATLSAKVNTDVALSTGTPTPNGNEKKFTNGTFLGWYLTDKYGFSYDAENSDIYDYNRRTSAIIYSMTASEAYNQGLITKLYQPGDTVTLKSSVFCFAVYDISASATKTYKVTWRNEGNVNNLTPSGKRTGTYEYGATPVYEGNTPTKTSTDAHIRYEFDGWTNTTTVTASTVVYAPDELPIVSKAITYYAHFKEIRDDLTVTFEDGSGNTLQTTKLEYGSTERVGYKYVYPTKDDVEYNYEFNGWMSDNGTMADSFDYVPAPTTDDVVYTAQYVQGEKKSYTITWANDDGSVIATDQVTYGDTPVYSGATPTKASDAQYDYTFNSWDTEPVPVTGPATYTATYTAVRNSFTVTFKNEDGTELQSSVVSKDTVPAYTGTTPSKSGASMNHTFVFSGWNDGTTTYALDALPAVNGDVTYTAVYTEVDIFQKHSLSLDGKIGVNFYLEIDDAIVQDAGKSVKVTFSGDELEASPNEVIIPAGTIRDTAQKLYKVTTHVPSTQMTKDIVATLTVNDEVVATDTYSVEQYALQLAGMDATASEISGLLHDIGVSMLVYGAEAQKVCTDDDASLYADRSLTGDNASDVVLANVSPELDSVADDTPAFDGLSYLGRSLVLDTDTTYSFYFEGSQLSMHSTINDDDLKDKLIVSFDDPLSDEGEAGYYTRFNIKNIPAPKVLENLSISVADTDYTFNAGNYIKNVLASDANRDLHNVVKALYNYSTKSKAYFDWLKSHS